MRYKTLTIPEKWIINGIPILFLIGALMHFLYGLCGNNLVIGAVAPVNESVWEHLKMVVLPVICWWTGYYILRGNKNNIDRNKWFTGALIALLTTLITIPFLYYFYTEAFGIEIVTVDIGILFIALFFGQLLGLHFYKHSNGINFYISLIIFVVFILVFIMFTFNPPHLPIFKDGPSVKYGIG